MLGYILEKTSALASETYDAVASVGEYIIDDIQSIPDAVEKGWTEGLITPSEDTETVEEPEDNI